MTAIERVREFYPEAVARESHMNGWMILPNDPLAPDSPAGLPNLACGWPYYPSPSFIPTEEEAWELASAFVRIPVGTKIHVC